MGITAGVAIWWLLGAVALQDSEIQQAGLRSCAEGVMPNATSESTSLRQRPQVADSVQIRAGYGQGAVPGSGGKHKTPVGNGFATVQRNGSGVALNGHDPRRAAQVDAVVGVTAGACAPIRCAPDRSVADYARGPT